VRIFRLIFQSSSENAALAGLIVFGLENILLGY
jgi:hypothetical protein